MDPSSNAPQRSRLRRFGALGAALAAIAFAAPARAQLDVNPPLPNVLLLVDTSGSMEFQIDGSEVTCNPGNPLSTNDKSRWITMLEVLTGSFGNDYSCEAVDRVSDDFRTGEYVLVTGNAPYDFRYPIPYHRPLSGASSDCTAGPGSLPGTNPFIYPSGAINYHAYNNVSSGCTPTQAEDGVIDAFDSMVRFGLMTFDTLTDASTGFTGSAMTSATGDLLDGAEGNWSYIASCSGCSAAMGRPIECADATEQEVGARNGAAPPWEGRMVNFGNPNDSERANEVKANQIQEILLSTRPFGATPIAGMLHDAEQFFWSEDRDDADPVGSTTPVDPYDDYGPKSDPYLQCSSAREQIVVLLTDGEPNLDLRPHCEPEGPNPNGDCPFDLPEDIADRLADPSDSTRRPIKTYVVGFALEDVDHDDNAGTPEVSCGSLVDSSGIISTACDAPDPDNIALRACCTLHKIAVAGDGEAFFASNPGELRSALTEILRRHFPTTTRTQPVPAGGGSVFNGSFRFSSGTRPVQFKPWAGTLTRQRWVCDSDMFPGVPTPEGPDATVGDDFVKNVNDAGPNDRLFYTFAPKDGSAVIQRGDKTVRTGIGSVVDGAGSLVPQTYADTASDWATAVHEDALAIPSPYPTGITTANAATDFYLTWLVGLDNDSGATDNPQRCPSPGSECELIGDIFHSTPAVIGIPSALLRDESYARFSLLNATRPTVLYTSTNDGFLHAFRVTSNDPDDADDLEKMVLTPGASNELWALAPPAVLPRLHTLYPYNHQLLLDGAPVVRDVVAVEPLDPNDLPTVFERTSADAQGGAGTWRTILIQGFGRDYGGYFALDVTNPVPGSDPADPELGGPRFLWQLTEDAAGGKLFGSGGVTPALTTLFFDPAGGSNPREIPVAVLPGGRGGTRKPADPAVPSAGLDLSDVNIDSRFVPRDKTVAYDFTNDAERAARSLTIVRLDTGEIIRTFRNTDDPDDAAIIHADLASRVTAAPLWAPITSQPVPFPAQEGAVADRILVGDAEGRIWKVNVGSTDPGEWEMTLFFDLYPASVASVTAHDFDDGQPIALPPVVSVDENGNMTVNAATGDQDALGYSPSQRNYVYSITELLSDDRQSAETHVNWYLPFDGGERAIGSLVLFNQTLYFATHTPTSNVCVATSKVWGMDYLVDVDGDPDDETFDEGGAPRLDDLTPPGPDVQFYDAADIASTSGTDPVIFGVALAQEPTCYETDDDAAGDDLVGFKGLRSISQVTPGKFSLIMHTTAPPSSDDSTGVGVEQIELEQPVSLSRISSWASIVE